MHTVHALFDLAQGPFFLTKIRAWISNVLMQDVITHPCPKVSSFCGLTDLIKSKDMD